PILEMVAIGGQDVGAQLRSDLESIASVGTEVGAISLVLLIFSAGAGFRAVNRGINAVLATPGKRQLLLVQLFAALTLVCLVAALFVWHALVGYLERLNMPDFLVVLARGKGPTGWIFETLVLVLGFVLLVKMVAVERHARLYRWIGGCFFAAGFQLVRAGLSFYLERAFSMREAYGSAATLVGLMFWLYAVATVLLLACALVRSLSQMKATIAVEHALNSLQESSHPREDESTSKADQDETAGQTTSSYSPALRDRPLRSTERSGMSRVA
ncbi:MAG: YihY/virulence factor BrkB family protein, partial [Myxococcales bacterium]|nr:YihY/virulence factor BrkB family protein [Myxococcales bacterium]